MKRYYPLFFVVGYLLFTLFIFNFGLIQWGGDYFNVNVFLLFTWTFLFLGYILASRIKISGLAKRPITLNINKIIYYGMICNLLTFPFAIYAYTGKLPTQISFDLSLQGEVHEQFYEHIMDSKGSLFRNILSFVRGIFAPLIYASIIFGLRDWSILRKRYKYFVAISILVQIIFSFARGKDKEIADLVIFFIAAGMINYDQNILKKLRKYLIILIIFIMFFNLFIDRRSGRYHFELPNCFSQADVCVDTKNSTFVPIIGRSNYIGLSMLENYFSQGYHGLSLAMTLEYQSTYGLGHASLLSRIYELLTRDSTLYKRTYNYRLRTKGWSDLYSWSTLYTWIANDISFVFVPIAIFFFGMILGLAWRQARLYNNDIAYMVFSLTFLSFIYSPANNQLGITLEMITTWYFWLFYWFYKNNKY